ncbi:hypothetical protein BGX29_006493 [Mortierella sp. GBA35]|nr:hypothetical protein BGX23_006141 [Mortierella sp. AD031]KAF9100546.1 hypothetical protein BGX29_006493 [Mortierella sp. GBA35]KAG0219746.1 hypothetical protein BGX33_001063 [Mortierella sp. NVP41]
MPTYPASIIFSPQSLSMMPKTSYNFHRRTDASLGVVEEHPAVPELVDDAPHDGDNEGNNNDEDEDEIADEPMEEDQNVPNLIVVQSPSPPGSPINMADPSYNIHPAT